MLKKIFLLFLALNLTQCSSSSPLENREPAAKSSSEKMDGLVWPSKTENTRIWDEFCKAPGGADSADVPTPNYENSKVKSVAKKFKFIAKNSFYLYPTIVTAYGLKDDKDSTPPKGVTPEAHVFLRYLCGEFRDRATMIEAKLNWLNNFNKLQDQAQPAITADSKDNVWLKMTAPSYRKFLNFSHDLWFARSKVNTKVTMGSYTEDRAVDGMTVCTTKFMFNEISKLPKDAQDQVPFKNSSGEFILADFEKAFNSYAKKCSQADLEDYYDFRGDSNFKPNSPEGNGMIWYANHIASNCQTTKKARPAPTQNVTNSRNIVTDEVCEDYFKNPFRRRWQATRAGLASWMMHDKTHDALFANDYGGILIWPHRITQDPNSITPFAYKIPSDDAGTTFSEPLMTWLEGFNQVDDMLLADFNFNKIAKNDQGFIFERLRDAVNRHTNWYQSKWDDGLGGKNSFKDQAYSPFVASSYEPSESDQFTFCGITVPCPPDGFKHWMFVFRVKGKNKFSTDDITNGKKIDFSSQWFDETSLGTTDLANREHAWDRMGTALEDELSQGAILYLHNITDSDQISNDGLN